jgi:hypothetical protein
MEGLGMPSLPPIASGASPTLGRSSVAVSLTPSFADALPASRP